ncbi:hypothetical protein ACI1TC_03685 [Lactococcus petauri]
MNAPNRASFFQRWWPLRTPSGPNNHWAINGTGGLVENPASGQQMFLRPSFIIRQ